MFRPRFAALGLALVTLLVYLPVRQHEFITYDDPDYVTENPVVQRGVSLAGLKWAFTTFHANNWHPLTWISHMVDCTLFGLDPGAHHLVNVLLHATNASLLFLLLLRLTAYPGPSLAVAALFAWHPLHVQSVAWVSERKDVLSTLFLILTIWAYAKSRGAASPGTPTGPQELRGEGKQRHQLWNGPCIGALALFALGLMAKPMLVTLPFVLVLLDHWPLRRAAFFAPSGTPLTRLLLEKWPFFLLTLASCVVTYAAQREQAVIGLEPHPLPLRVANALLSYGVYLWKMVWPIELSVIYPLRSELPWGQVAVAAAALSLASFVALRFGNTKPHLLVGWFWYIGTLVPVIGIVQVGGQALADRYTYVPYIGIFIALAYEISGWLHSRSMQFRRAASAVVAALLVAAIAVTSWQLGFWRNSERLFRRALAVTGENAVALVNLGVALEGQGRDAEALDLYLRAVRHHPGMVQAHNNAANLLDAAGRTEDAIRHYREALRLKPNAALAHANLAGALSRAGRSDEARSHFAQAARLAPRDPRVPYLAAKAHLREGRSTEAVNEFQQALTLDPNHVQTLTFLSRTLASTASADVRNPNRALQLAERATALTSSSDPFVLETLAIAAAAAGDRARALRVLEAAIELSHSQGDSAGAEALQKRKLDLQ